MPPIPHPSISETWAVLTIGGLDPSGGAGLPADARAIAAFGAHCCGVATAVIAQNTRGVARVEPVSADMLAAQLDNLLEDIAPSAVKIGLLPCAAAVSVVAERLRELKGIPIIIDPVLAPSSGAGFVDADTMARLLQELTPLAELVTPNIPEATALCGARIADRMAMRGAVRLLKERCGSGAALLKGGHLPPLSPPGDAADDSAQLPYDSLDILWDGNRLWELRGLLYRGAEVRGTGCMLASAIAAQRARGVPLLEACRRAKVWLLDVMEGARAVGDGRLVG